MFESRSPSNWWPQVLLFLVIFGLFQYVWGSLRISSFGIFIIEGLTVHSTTSLINLLDPSIKAVGQGTHIVAQGGGINVINGCEGVEVMLLLAASMLVTSLAWQDKLFGLLIGCALIFVLNQVRLIAMFFALRENRNVFEMLHGTVAPLLLIAVTTLFFSWWLGRHSDRKNHKAS